MGGQKLAKQIYRNSRIVHSKNVVDKIVGKSAKNVFLYSHEYRDQKMGGKNARNNFSRNTRTVREKNIWEKIVGKK